jgi:predicted nuclease of predicted toxin-antitoxin system
LEQASDEVIRQYAIDNDFIIVTKDADFYEMNLIYGQPPKIVWLKMGNQSKAETIKVLQENRESIGSFPFGVMQTLYNNQSLTVYPVKSIEMRWNRFSTLKIP